MIRMKFLLLLGLFVSCVSGGVDSLYTAGNNAYDREDYVAALKYLFAYRTVLSDTLEQKCYLQFKLKLDSCISDCETQLYSKCNNTKNVKRGKKTSRNFTSSNTKDDNQIKQEQKPEK